MHGKRIALILLIGGLVVGGVTIVGYRSVNQKSDIQILHELAMEQQAEQQRKREELLDQVPEAPAVCDGVPITAFSRVCENDVYEHETTIPWATGLEPDQADCVQASYDAGMERYHQLNGEVYEPSEPRVDWTIILHACSVSGDLMMLVDGVDPEDPEQNAAEALNAWHQHKYEQSPRYRLQ